jgi:hypothetical protein
VITRVGSPGSISGRIAESAGKGKTNDEKTTKPLTLKTLRKAVITADRSKSFPVLTALSASSASQDVSAFIALPIRLFCVKDYSS